MDKYKNKMAMRFNVSNLERTIVAMLNNGYNKKLASNIIRLFEMFEDESYKNDYDKEIRVYLINKIGRIIIDENIVEKDSILSFLDLSGKYQDSATEIMDRLFELTIDESELLAIDKLISQQLRYGLLGRDSEKVVDMLTNMQTENYEDFDDFMENFDETLTEFSRGLRSARESINDSKKDISLGSESFVKVLDKIIEGDRNPSAKIRTGLQSINEMFNGGYEKGQIYF